MLQYLIQKEFLQLRRNAFLPKIIFLFPVMIMCVMPWVMNMEVKSVVVDVVDHDHTPRSRQLVHRIEASGYFVFNGQKASYDAALSEIESGRVDVVLVIPRGFRSVLIAANAVNGTKGAMGSAYLSQIVNLPQTTLSVTGSGVSTKYLYNPHLNYKVFMIPALMGILLMMLCGFLPALNIVGEKEAGTIEQMNVTPVPKWAFIFSKLIPYWLIALVVMTICFVLSWAIYGITCQGSLLWVYVLAVLLSLTFSAVGLIVSNYSDTMQQAMLVMWFIVVCLMLLSGLFTPVRSMPDWAQLTTLVNPMHFFIDGIRTVFVRGGGFHSIAPQLGALAAYVLVTGSWAVWSYRKNH